MVRSVRIMKKARVPFYLTDQAIYSHVKNLVVTGRAVAVQVNLLGDSGMASIGDTSRKLGIPVRTLYLSNVEDYWKYRPSYVRNLQNLNFDGNSFVLRTLAAKKSNGDYRYVLQDGLNLLKWLKSGEVNRTRDMFPSHAIKKRNEVQLVTIKTSQPQCAN